MLFQLPGFCGRFTLLLLFTALSACAPGLDREPGGAALPDQFGAGQNGSFSAQPVELEQWWGILQDPALSSLIDRAVRGNLDLKSIEYRIREARAQRAIVRGDLFPTLNQDNSYSRDRISERGLPFGPPFPALEKPTLKSLGSGGRAAADGTDGALQSPFNLLPEFNLYQIGFDSSWEIDLFGKNRHALEAATADLHGAVEDSRSTLVALLAEVARNYVELRGTQKELRIADDTLAIDREVLTLARNQKIHGMGTDFDVVRAEAEVHFTEAKAPALRREEAQAMYRIALLLGEPPHALDAELAPPKTIALAVKTIPIGVPSDLIRRRPDIRKAETAIAAAAAREQEARSDLYPKFTIGGTFSLASADTTHLFNWDSRSFSAGPGISIPLFDAGARVAAVKGREAELQMSLTQYRQTVLTAIKDVEDAMAALTTEQQRRAALEKGAQSQRDAVAMARSLYKEGLSDFLSVLQAENTLYASEDDLAKSETFVNVSVIALYKALGGGWEQFEPQIEKK